MTPNALETLSSSSDPKGVDGDFLDYQARIEELYPDLIRDPETFVESKVEEAMDNICPVAWKIMNKGWYPELSENLKNAAISGVLSEIVWEIEYHFPIERLEVAREVLKELDNDSDIEDTQGDPRVKEEIRRVSSVLCPELIQKFEATEDSLEEVVSIFPENRIHMLLDSLKRRSEREKAYDEYSKLDSSEQEQVLKSLSVSWSSYRVLYEMYPELLEDPETLTLNKPQSQQGLGFIKNPAETQKLSDLELFSLIYTVDRSLWCMLVGNAIGSSKGIVTTIAAVRFEKFHRAGDFLIQEVKRRLDEDSNLSYVEFIEEVFVPWFCFHEKFLKWKSKGVKKKDLSNALEVELLMRALKDGYGEEIKKSLPKKDAWRQYITKRGDAERIKFLLR